MISVSNASRHAKVGGDARWSMKNTVLYLDWCYSFSFFAIESKNLHQHEVNSRAIEGALEPIVIVFD